METKYHFLISKSFPIYSGPPGLQGPPGPKGEQGLKGNVGEVESDFTGPVSKYYKLQQRNLNRYELTPNLI